MTMKRMAASILHDHGIDRPSEPETLIMYRDGAIRIISARRARANGVTLYES